MPTYFTSAALATILLLSSVTSLTPTASAESFQIAQVSNPLTRTPKSWKTPQLVRTFPGQARQLAINPNGQILAGVMDDLSNTIKLWQIATGTEIATLTGHSQTIDAIAFSPNGQTFASSSYDNYGNVLTIQLWDSRTGKELRTIRSGVAPKVYRDSNGTEQRGNGSAIAFSADSQTLVTVAGGNSTIQLWDISTGRVRRILTGGEGNTLIVSPDGETLARITNRTVQLWNLKTGKPLRTLQANSPLIRGLFSSDSQSLLTWVGLEPQPDQGIQSWNLKTGQPSPRVGAFHWDAQLAISPDTRTVAVGSPSTSLQLFDLQTETPVANLNEILNWSSAIAFSPDGQLFAASTSFKGDENCIKIWR